MLRSLLFSLTVLSLSLSAKAQSQHPVVLELFTSQGCSSCPAADKLLAKVLAEAETAGRPVYGLSFHVNYWDYLGWKDPYSTEAYTNRQRYYAQAFRENSVYTPQLVINGREHHVGSNEGAIRKAIKEQLLANNDVELMISALSIKGEVLILDFKSSGNENHVVQVAIVERDVKNFVPRGENKGRELHHDQVVRGFHSYTHTRAGRVELKIPAALDLSKSAVLIFLQDKNTWQILTADQRELQTQ